MSPTQTTEPTPVRRSTLAMPALPPPGAVQTVRLSTNPLADIPAIVALAQARAPRRSASRSLSALSPKLCTDPVSLHGSPARIYDRRRVAPGSTCTLGLRSAHLSQHLSLPYVQT